MRSSIWTSNVPSTSFVGGAGRPGKRGPDPFGTIRKLKDAEMLVVDALVTVMEPLLPPCTALARHTSPEGSVHDASRTPVVGSGPPLPRLVAVKS
jgi:hypothetical protein